MSVNNVLVSSVPPYFSWVLDNLLAVSAFPYHHTHLRYLIENKIHTVISISPEQEPPFHTKPDLKVIHLKTLESRSPSLDECQFFVSLMESAKRRREGVLVHDVKGTGRAGVLVACYLLKLWECTSDYVIDHLRLIRPISIENDEQESMIRAYYKTVADNFRGYYSRHQQPSGWDDKTTHLGKSIDTLLTTLPTYAIKYSPYVSGDNATNAELAQSEYEKQAGLSESQPLHVISQDYQMA